MLIAIGFFPKNKVSPNVSSVKINEIFCKYPLARDTDSEPGWHWHYSERGIRECNLHFYPGTYKPKVKLWVLGPSWETDRYPDRFDLNLLLHLWALIEVVRRKNSNDMSLDFDSWDTLLQTLGYSVSLSRRPNRSWDEKRESIKSGVSDSLYLWCKIGVVYLSKNGEIESGFHPFLKPTRFPRAKNGPVSIKLSDEYIDTLTRGTKKIPLPLPLNSEASLNLALLLIDSAEWKNKRPFYRDFEELCELLSITGDDESQLTNNMIRTVCTVNWHYSKHGWHYRMVWDGSNVYWQRNARVKAKSGKLNKRR